MKKLDCIFASSKGVLYIKVKAIMSPMVAMIDGIPMVFLGKGKTPYLPIDLAIDWVIKEINKEPSYMGGRGAAILAKLREERKMFNSEQQYERDMRNREFET
jgi:hypothetical protein